MTQDIKDFFGDYPQFYTTSDGSFPNRINHRYRVLIQQNKQIIYDSRILDIASHDGRWSFAAIKNGAGDVLGIEGRKEHINNCKANFDKYDVEKDRYTFVHGDVHTQLPKIGANSIDIIFCFGFFYHTLYHMTMLDEFRRINTKYVIMDDSVFIGNSHIANEATIQI